MPNYLVDGRATNSRLLLFICHYVQMASIELSLFNGSDWLCLLSFTYNREVKNCAIPWMIGQICPLIKTALSWLILWEFLEI